MVFHFSHFKTTIRYGLPQGTKGQINIFNSAGSLVKTLITNASGQSELSADGLKAGTYSYSLYADGKLIGTQKMVVVK